MAFKIENIGGFGSGKLGDIEVSDGVLDSVNSYARVSAIDELNDDKIAIDAENAIIGKYENFSAGVEVLIHVSSSATETEYLGKYTVAKILLAQNGLITLNKNFTDLIPRDQFDFYSVQIITIANFDCLKIKAGGVVMPPLYDMHKLRGGILAIRCYDSLRLEGGHICLTDCGIPSNSKHLFRPLTTQETAANGEGDYAKFSGQENFITAERFLLNAGDGAVLIAAKNIYCNADSRIGNIKTHGAHFCRGAENSAGVRPSNITNIGGSTIFIAAENIYNFDAKIIAKYRDAAKKEADIGRGLCRCYIATNTKLRNDEGLYAYDVLSDTNRLKNKLNVYDFGTGNFGSLSNPRKALNNYAAVTSITQGGCRLSFDDETTNGLAPIDEGAMILVQVIQKDNQHVERAGDIIKAKVMSRGDNYIVIDFPAPIVNLDEYAMQIISVPQFQNFTLSTNHNATTKFNGRVGGVLAIAVKGICDLSEGKLNVEGKGGAYPYGADGLAYIGNAQSCDKLPLGSGHGSVFLLAKSLVLNDNSRIGATYSGTGTGARFGGSNSESSNFGGGYSGNEDNEGTGSAGGYNGGGGATQEVIGGVGGSGANGGTSENLNEVEFNKICGGYGGNGKDFDIYEGGKQGAHVLTIANNITNFNQACFSTGGEGGHGILDGLDGAAGYGGGAANKGSSGGSSGWCFVYSN